MCEPHFSLHARSMQRSNYVRQVPYWAWWKVAAAGRGGCHTLVASPMKFMSKVLDTNGNVLDALRLHSITLTSLSLLMN